MIDVREVVVEVKHRLDADRKAIREALTDGPPAPGLVAPTDEEFMEFVGGMLGKYRPEPILDPNGVWIVESPWILALAYVAGGKQIVDRILRIRKKAEATDAVL
jgi:hypothetical protein